MTVTLGAQATLLSASDELDNITSEYLLSKAQQTQVEQLISKRDLDLRTLASDRLLDEPQQAIKRSSIVDGFKGSLDLLLNDDQRAIAQKETIKDRRDRIATIERLKKKGYAQSEILKQLDNK